MTRERDPSGAVSRFQWAPLCALILAVVLAAVVAVRPDRRSERDSDAAQPAQIEGVSASPLAPRLHGGERVPVDSRSAASEDAAACAIRVIDEVGAPLEGVRLWSCGEHGESALGATDAAGLLDAVLRLGEQVVRGRSEGWVVGPVALSDPLPAELTLRARPSGILRGVALHHDRAPAGEGLDVLVHDSRFRPSMSSFEHRTPGPFVAWARTDDASSFEVGGLDPEGTYSILVGGAGLVCRGPLHGIVPDGRTVDVYVVSVYGAVIEPTDAAGLPIGIDASLQSPRGRLSYDRAEADIGVGIRDAIHLAGLAHDALDDLPANAIPFFLTTKDRRQSVGSLEYRFEFPGYRPETVSFEATRLDVGLSYFVFRLTPDSRGVGQLALRLASPGGASVGSGAAGVLRNSYIELRSESETLRFSLDPGRDETILAGIPVGRYMVSVSLHGGLTTFPSDATAFYYEIAEGRNELTVDVPPSGSLVIEMQQPAGVPYRGHARLLLTPADEVHHTDGGVEFRGVVQQVFYSPPYRFDALPAGMYCVFADDPFSTVGAPRYVTVQAGEEARVAISAD